MDREWVSVESLYLPDGGHGMIRMRNGYLAWFQYDRTLFDLPGISGPGLLYWSKFDWRCYPPEYALMDFHSRKSYEAAKRKVMREWNIS